MIELTKEEKQKLMEVYRKLRVADVRDGMDWNMMHFMGSIHTDEIKPLFRTSFCGFAKTVQFVPTNRTIPTMDPESYTKFSNHWYGNVATYHWGKEIGEDDVLVQRCYLSLGQRDWRRRCARARCQQYECRYYRLQQRFGV